MPGTPQTYGRVGVGMPELRHPRHLATPWDDTRPGMHAASVMAMLDVADMPAEHGNCYDKDPEMFYPDTRRADDILAAKAVCDGCLIVRECLILADDDYGIWGGQTPAERRHGRRAA